LSSREPWHRNTWLILTALILFMPLGIPLLWWSGKYTRKTRLWLTLGSALLFFFALGSRNSRDLEQSAMNDLGAQAGGLDTSPNNALSGQQASRSTSSGQPPAITPVVSADADPAPPVAHLAAEVPDLLAQLQTSSSFRKLQPTAHPDTKLFLTIVSKLLAEGGAPHQLMERARRAQLHDAAVKTYLITARTGRLPEPVEALAQGFLRDRGEAANQKTWDIKDPSYDVTALAAWLNRQDPAYLRALITARRTGPAQWTNHAANRQFSEPWITWIALPGAAYERLARMTELTDDEWRDWCAWFGQELVEKIDPELGQAQRGCGCTAGRAISWEEWRTRWPLTVPGGCLKCERQLRAGRTIDMVVLQHADRRYAINGSASSDRRNVPVDSVWADDPENAGMKIGIGALISTGLQLCEL
jgi:hypothetical protein